MSYNKEKMLELIERARGRYRDPQIAALYAAQSGYDRLAYHNFDHVIDVGALFELLVKMDEIAKSAHQQILAARTAVALHDIGHSGWSDTHVSPEDGLDNIARAIQIARTYMTAEGTSAEVQDRVCAFIEQTRYPEPTAQIDDTASAVVAAMRDADILWGLLPGNAEQSMLGLWMEQVASGAAPDAPCDIEALLTRQIHFIRDYQPHTRAGRHFKQAFYVQATEAWALVALEFMRQLEAAKAVEELADDELLRLSGAIKQSLPRPE